MVYFFLQLIAHIPVVLIAHISVVVSITPHSVAVETQLTLLKLLGERANTTPTGSTLLHEDILSIATAY